MTEERMEMERRRRRRRGTTTTRLPPKLRHDFFLVTLMIFIYRSTQNKLGVSVRGVII
jgi:hypothetical protein